MEVIRLYEIVEAGGYYSVRQSEQQIEPQWSIFQRLSQIIRAQWNNIWNS